MRFALAATVSFVMFAANVANARHWSDSTGTYHVDANFVAVQDGKVTLQTDDGRTIAGRVRKIERCGP